MNILFTIPCFQRGYPKGYTRTTTRGARFDKKYQEYQVWKDYVWNQAQEALESIRIEDRKKSKVHIVCHLKNLLHPDIDNIFKGVLDSLADKKYNGFIEKRLYKNDKYICGSMEYFYDKKNPRIEVSIEL